MAPRPPEPMKLRDARTGGALSVRSLSCAVLVDGPLAESTLEVSFVNDLDADVEGDLVFPLPPFSALGAVRCAHPVSGAR